MTGATIRTLLRVLLAGLGVSAVLIALSILTLGAGATAAAGERVFDALSGWRGPDSPPWPPTMDNELRFYAALWGAYGPRVLVADDWRAAPLLPAAHDDRTGSTAAARPALVARGRA
jgi:hypothetical protein